PTYAYKIGPFEVSRYGVLTWEDRVDNTANEIAGQLADAGFEGKAEGLKENATTADTELQEGNSEDASAEEPDAEETSEKEIEEPTDAEDDGPAALSVSLPDDLSDEAYSNLEKIIASKQTLMKHAFQSEAITVERKDGQIVFSGFTASDGDHTDAYLKYITLLTKFAKEANRVTGKDYPVDNEKFAFRCFIIRIGMIGAEYKKARKILLENLTGNSSWKNRAPEKVAHAETEESAETASETEVSVNE
ncbi:MAG: hypothetical protein SPL56_04805, partial [Lachnospiraceae bacterium]|nr:hypothetical protein [Lachnospiraceae bacterium]